MKKILLTLTLALLFFYSVTYRIDIYNARGTRISKGECVYSTYHAAEEDVALAREQTSDYTYNIKVCSAK